MNQVGMERSSVSLGPPLQYISEMVEAQPKELLGAAL